MSEFWDDNDLVARSRLGKLIVVAGPPGAGKSTAVRLLQTALEPEKWFSQDKDFLAKLELDLLKVLGHTRDDDFFNGFLKKLEYKTLFANVKDLRRQGANVVMSAPFTAEAHDKKVFDSMVRASGGGGAAFFWVNVNSTETLLGRMCARDLPRDHQMLDNLEYFTGRHDADFAPDFDHFAVDNSGTTADLDKSVREAVAQMKFRQIRQELKLEVDLTDIA